MRDIEQLRGLVELHRDIDSHCHGDESLAERDERQMRFNHACYEFMPALTRMLERYQKIEKLPDKWRKDGVAGRWGAKNLQGYSVVTHTEWQCAAELRSALSGESK